MKLLLRLIPLFWVTCLPLAVWAQEGRQEVTIELKVPRTQFVQGEPIRALVTIRVTGRRKLRLPYNARYNWLFFVDVPDGEQLALREMPEPDPAPGAPLPMEELVPGQTRVYETNLLNEAPPLFGSSGTHTVFLRLTWGYLDHQRIEPYVDSNRIKFHISKPSGENARAYKLLVDYIGSPERSQYLLEAGGQVVQRVVKDFPGTLYAGYGHVGMGNQFRDWGERNTSAPGGLREAGRKDLRRAAEHYRTALTKYREFQFKDQVRLKLAETLLLLREFAAARREAIIILDMAQDDEIGRKARFMLLMIPELEKAAQEQQK